MTVRENLELGARGREARRRRTETLAWVFELFPRLLERQRQVKEPIDPPHGAWVLPFFYPPFFALLLTPLAGLSFSRAFALVTAFNVTLLVAALATLMRLLQLTREQKNWLVLATFCNYGVHNALVQAQTSFLTLMLLSLYLLTLTGNRAGRAGTLTPLSPLVRLAQR